MSIKKNLFAALLLGAISLAGCSRTDTVEVAGTVTWQGQPVPYGEVVFVADDPHIAVAAGKISEGAYKFLSKPGKKRVEIQSTRNTGRRNQNGLLINEQYIPTRYNSNSELAVEVTFDGDNRFDFALTP